MAFARIGRIILCGIVIVATPIAGLPSLGGSANGDHRELLRRATTQTLLDSGIDSDGDGVGDELDNCPFTPNPHQEDGVFVAGPVIASEGYGMTFWSARMVDLDADGDLDIYWNSEDDQYDLFCGWNENLTGGSFSPPRAVGKGVRPLLVFDVDLDGDNDFVAKGIERTALLLFENLGSREFAEARKIADVFNFMSETATADLDSDGTPDIVSISSDDIIRPEATIEWYSNLGSGHREQPRIIDICEDCLGFIELWVADIDGDGLPDVIAAENQRYAEKFRNVFYYRNQGDGRFAPSQFIAAQDRESAGFRGGSVLRGCRW